IPTICLIDTDGDPDMADIPIPGNDDSMRAIDVIIRELCAAIAEGKQVRQTRAPEDAGGPDGQGRRRSARAQYRSDDVTPPAEDAPGGAPGPDSADAVAAAAENTAQ